MKRFLIAIGVLAVILALTPTADAFHRRPLRRAVRVVRKVGQRVVHVPFAVPARLRARFGCN